MYFIEIQESDTASYPNQMAEFSFIFFMWNCESRSDMYFTTPFFQKCDALPGGGGWYLVNSLFFFTR